MINCSVSESGTIFSGIWFWSLRCSMIQGYRMPGQGARIRRPRVRGLEKRFESNLLPLFRRRTREVSDLLPELYLHGLALGDFELALRALLGQEAPLSPSTVARVKERWQDEAVAWQQRSVAALDLVYLWVDGVYVKAELDKEKAALLVAIGGLADGRKVLVALRSGYRESAYNDERGRVAIRGAAAAHGRGEALQEGSQRHRGDLEDAVGGRDEVPEAERPGATSRREGGSRIPRRSSSRRASGAGRCLTRLHTY